MRAFVVFVFGNFPYIDRNRAPPAIEFSKGERILNTKRAISGQPLLLSSIFYLLVLVAFSLL